MENKLKRYLKSEEIVHHINGIRDDNRIENLALTNRKNHETKTVMKILQSKIRFLEDLLRIQK